MAADGHHGRARPALTAEVPPATRASRVKTHVKRILMNLCLRDRLPAVIFAYESGLASPGSRSPV